VNRAWEWFAEGLAYPARVRQIEESLNQERYTVREAAEVLRCHEKTVRQWIREGRLRAMRPSPRKTIILKGDLAAYMAKKAEG